MKSSEICVGVTYTNGRTQRKVLAIGEEYRPYYQWLNQEAGVLYAEKGGQFRLFLSEFANWAEVSVCDHLWHRNPGLIIDCSECGEQPCTC